MSEGLINLINAMDVDQLPLLSEDGAEKLLIQKTTQLMQIGKQLFKMFCIIMISGTVLSLLLSFMFANGRGIAIEYLVILEMLFFTLFLLCTHNTLFYFLRGWKEIRNGSWFMEIKCGCPRNTFKKLSKEDMKELEKNGEQLLTLSGKKLTCRSCGREMKIKKTWRVKIDRKKYRDEIKSMLDNMKIPDDPFINASDDEDKNGNNARN